MDNNRSTSRSKKSGALKIIGTSAAICVVAAATGISLGTVAAALLGAALAVKFT